MVRNSKKTKKVEKIEATQEIQETAEPKVWEAHEPEDPIVEQANGPIDEPSTEPTEEEKPIEEEIKAVEKKMNQIWKVNVPVFQKSSFIKTKTLRTPVSLFELPEDIRKYLLNMWWWSNVYEKGEEWLVKHWADMEIIKALKKFISEHYF